MTQNLIAINKLCWTEVRNPSQTSMHLDFTYNLLISYCWHKLDATAVCIKFHLPHVNHLHIYTLTSTPETLDSKQKVSVHTKNINFQKTSPHGHHRFLGSACGAAEVSNQMNKQQDDLQIENLFCQQEAALAHCHSLVPVDINM